MSVASPREGPEMLPASPVDGVRRRWLRRCAGATARVRGRRGSNLSMSTVSMPAYEPCILSIRLRRPDSGKQVALGGLFRLTVLKNRGVPALPPPRGLQRQRRRGRPPGRSVHRLPPNAACLPLIGSARDCLEVPLRPETLGLPCDTRRRPERGVTQSSDYHSEGMANFFQGSENQFFLQIHQGGFMIVAALSLVSLASFGLQWLGSVLHGQGLSCKKRLPPAP